MGRVIAKIRLGKGAGGSKLIWIGSKKGRKFDLKMSRLRPSFWAFLRQKILHFLHYICTKRKRVMQLLHNSLKIKSG